MKTYVIRNAQGQFLRRYGRWTGEYPDAETWTRLTNARKAAKEAGGKVWADYGSADEREVL